MITVVLNCYKRLEYLQEQIQSIRNQTIQVDDIWIWYNKPEDSQQYDLSGLGCKVITCNHNFKFHGRFALGLLAQTEYVAFFDDDTIPGSNWFESCLHYLKQENLILGSTGVLYKGNGYDPHIKYGWNGVKNTELQYVDLVGHSWFMKRSTLQYLWYEDPISWDNGEDIQLSGFAYKYGRIKTAVPPHPENNKNIWGSSNISMQYGNDQQASNKKTNHSLLRNKISNELLCNGYIKVIDR